MIDVANYAHVPKGPGVVLIGHGSDYFIDEGEGRLGLLHSRKRGAPDAGDRLADAFRRTLHAASLLEATPRWPPGGEGCAFARTSCCFASTTGSPRPTTTRRSRR